MALAMLPPAPQSAEPPKGPVGRSSTAFVIGLLFLFVGAGLFANAAWLAGGCSSNSDFLRSLCPNGPRYADASVRVVLGFVMFVLSTVVLLRVERAAKAAAVDAVNGRGPPP
jgi:hypothetical protein